MNFIEHVHEPRRLLLVWQGPEGSSRMRWAVAELKRLPDERVQFRYLLETPDMKQAQAEGFVNFPAFRKLDQPYDLGVVETFMRRLPPSSRGDYAQYLEQFRLRPTKPISAFSLLACTGAKLPSDGFSLVDPLDDVDSGCEVILEVAGFRHVSEIPASEIREGLPVRFVAEPANLHDRNATAVHVLGRKVGFVPRQQAPAIRSLLARDGVRAVIERVNGRPDRPVLYLFARIEPVAAFSPNRSGANS